MASPLSLIEQPRSTAITSADRPASPSFGTVRADPARSGALRAGGRPSAPPGAGETLA
jgi:hypothetical protein